MLLLSPLVSAITVDKLRNTEYQHQVPRHPLVSWKLVGELQGVCFEAIYGIKGDNITTSTL